MNIYKLIRMASLVLVFSFSFHCAKLPYVPDEDAIIYLNAFPSSIEAGENAVVQVMGEKGSGYPLPDGTIVYLFSTSGQIDSEVSLRYGRAEATYTSDSDFAGNGIITAHSGQASIFPEQLVITISETEEPDITYLYISAQPLELPKGGGESEITVMAFDKEMVPVANKNIWLETTAGSLSGNGIFTTGNNGEVEAILTTNRTATVTAKYKELSASRNHNRGRTNGTFIYPFPVKNLLPECILGNPGGFFPMIRRGGGCSTDFFKCFFRNHKTYLIFV